MTYSIIVACYNIEQYIDECVSSLVHQTYQDIEILLVDDGSLDGTLEKCKQWANKDQRIVVIHQKNAGSGAARNAGLKQSRGKYLFFVDGDDFIDTQYVDRINQIVEKSHPDMIITNHEYHLFENGKQIERVCFPIDETQKTNKLFLDFIFDGHYGVPGGGCHNVYCTDFVKLNEIYFGTYKLSQDLDFFLQIMFHRPSYVFSDVKYYYYRRRSGSAVSSPTTEKMLDRIHMLKKWWNCTDNEGVCSGEKMQYWIADNFYANLVFTIPIASRTIDYGKLKSEYLGDDMFASYYPFWAKCMKICGFRFTLIFCKLIGYGKEAAKMLVHAIKNKFSK